MTETNGKERTSGSSPRRRLGHLVLALTALVIIGAVVGLAGLAERRFKEMEEELAAQRDHLLRVQEQREFLQSRVANLVDDSEKLHDQMSATRVVVAEIVGPALEDVHQQIESNRRLLEELNGSLESLSGSLEGVAGRQEHMARLWEDTNRRRQGEIEEKGKTLERLGADLRTLDRDIDSRFARLDAVQKTLEDVREEIAQVRETHARSIQSFESDLDRTRELHLILQGTITRLEKLNDEVSRLKVQLP